MHDHPPSRHCFVAARALGGAAALAVLGAGIYSLKLQGAFGSVVPWLAGALALALVFGVGADIARMATVSLRRGILNQHVLVEFGAFAGLVGGAIGLALRPPGLCLGRLWSVRADAVLIEQKLGALGRVSGIYVSSTDRLKAVGAGYIDGNLRGTDYSVLIGSFRADEALGVNFSSSMSGLGLRGEFTATRPNSGARYARALLGADYGFANSLNATIEAYDNGQGAVDPTRYDLNTLIAGHALNLGRWYSAVAVSYEVTPLVKVGAYGVWNAGDGSLVLWPRLEWSAKANLDLIAGIQQFTGSARSEYGRLSNLVQYEACWFF